MTNSEGTSSYGYDAVGNRSSLSYPNGASQTWGYDSRSRLTTTSIYNASGALIQLFDYTLHPTGRRTRITELDGRTIDYTYNSLYWLTGETISDAVNGNYTASYLYDAVGNRTQGTQVGVTTQYSYDDNDRITQQGGVTYSYDANGNMLEENDQGTITVYGYNSQNQMVQNTVGGLTTNYQYNTDGIRHAQSDSIATTRYLVDANRSYAQVLAESVNGSLDVAYHYGDDLISQSRSGGVSYFHVDGLGSTRVLTDSLGSQTDGYAYAAFGEVLAQDGVTDNSYLYTGEQYDANLDQYYLRARYYDQGVGRFTQMDSWMGRSSDPVTLHKYFYGNNDPVLFVDPAGKFAGTLGGQMVAIGGVATLGVGASYIAGNVFQSNVTEDNWKGNRPSDLQIGLLVLATMAHSSSNYFDLIGTKTRKSEDRECGWLYGPYYRYELKWQLADQAWLGWLYGGINRSGGSIAVNAYGWRKGGPNEVKFCTPVEPEPGQKATRPTWYQGSPGVIDHGSDTVKIPIKALEVNP